MSDLLGLEQERPSTGADENVTPSGPDPDLIVRAKRGANWFYWIAGLSVVNTVIFVAGGNVHFLAGLGITEIADAVIDASIREGAPVALKAVSIVFDLIVIMGFVLAGYFANKLSRTAFLVGIIFYAIDAVIVLLLQDFFMAAFHAFAGYSLIRGYLACRELKAFSQANPVISTPPPPPPSA